MIKKILFTCILTLSMSLVSAQSTGEISPSNTTPQKTIQRTIRARKPLPVSFAAFIRQEYKLNYIQDFSNLHYYCNSGQIFGLKNTFNVESCKEVFGDYIRDFNDSLRFINNPLTSVEGLIRDRHPRSEIKTFINSLITSTQQTDGSVHEDLVRSFLVLGTLRLDYNYYKSLLVATGSVQKISSITITGSSNTGLSLMSSGKNMILTLDPGQKPLPVVTNKLPRTGYMPADI